MALSSSIGREIRKFDDKNFALWKEMMKDVLIIRGQIEAIRHNSRWLMMTLEEWWLIDEIMRSTIQMHLAKNIYFKFQHGKRVDFIGPMGEASINI